MGGMPAVKQELIEAREYQLRVVEKADVELAKAGLDSLLNVIEKQTDPGLKKLTWFIYWERVMGLDRGIHLPERHLSGYARYKEEFGLPDIPGKLPIKPYI